MNFLDLFNIVTEVQTFSSALSLSLSFWLFHIFHVSFNFVLFHFMLFWWSIFFSDGTNLNFSYACNVQHLSFFKHSLHNMAIDGTSLPVYSPENSKSHVYCPSMIWMGDSLWSSLNLPNHAMSSILQMSARLGSSWLTTK